MIDNTDVMPWGKHKDLKIKFLPMSYLKWGQGNIDWDDEIANAFAEEVRRRDNEDDHTWDY